MEFNFIETQEDDDDETLDLTDLFEEDTQVDEAIEVAGLNLSFTEEEIPESRTLSSPEVREKALSTRRNHTKVTKQDRRKEGCSLFCSYHPYTIEFNSQKPHFSNLCEWDQSRGKISCTCHCHTERGYVFSQPNSLSGSDEEEDILILD